MSFPNAKGLHGSWALLPAMSMLGTSRSRSVGILSESFPWYEACSFSLLHHFIHDADPNLCQHICRVFFLCQSDSKSLTTTPLSKYCRMDSTTNLLDNPTHILKVPKDSNGFKESFSSSLNSLADHPESNLGEANHEDENPEPRAPASYLTCC